MNFAKKLSLAGLAVSLLWFTACDHGAGLKGGKGGVEQCASAQAGPNPGNHYGQQKRQFRVYIYTDTDGKCYADVDVATLWTKVGSASVSQTVCWVSDDKKDYVLNFKKGKRGASPFKDPAGYFTLLGTQGPGTIASGPVDSNSHGYYDFVIVAGTNPDGTVCSGQYEDPGYIIKP